MSGKGDESNENLKEVRKESGSSSPVSKWSKKEKVPSSNIESDRRRPMKKGGIQTELSQDDIYIEVGDHFTYDIILYPNEGGSMHEAEFSHQKGEDTSISIKFACHGLHTPHWYTQHL